MSAHPQQVAVTPVEEEGCPRSLSESTDTDDESDSSVISWVVADYVAKLEALSKEISDWWSKSAHGAARERMVSDMEDLDLEVANLLSQMATRLPSAIYPKAAYVIVRTNFESLKKKFSRDHLKRRSEHQSENDNEKNVKRRPPSIQSIS